MSLSQDCVVRLLLVHRGRLLGYIRSLVGDEHLSEDIFQEVSILAIHKRHQIESDSHFPAWARRVAMNKSLHALRSAKSKFKLLDEPVLELIESHWREADSLDTVSTMESLRDCLGKLSPYPRKLVQLRYEQGLKGPALAESLGRSLNTVYVALSRAHRALRECIEQRIKQEEQADVRNR